MTFDPHRPYKIINRKSGAALSAADVKIGSAAWLWRFVNGGGQVWFLMDAGDGFVRIENRHSGRILAAPSGGHANGTALHVWDDLATLAEQHWRIDPGPSGFVRLTNRASGRVASCRDGGTHNGTVIHLWDALEGFPDQDWALLPAPAYDPAAAYRIFNKKSGKDLCVVDGGSANGSRINLFPYIDAEDQRWHLIDLGNGFLKIVNHHSGRILSTVEGESANGTRLHLWDDLATAPDQHWVITPTGDGFVKITNRLCGRAVSCLDGSIAHQTPIHLWDFLGTEPDQEWFIEKVEERVTVNARRVIARPSPYMTGMCLEDVNHSLYGGIDSQMIFGESFQEPAAFDPNALYRVINEKSDTALSVRHRGYENGSLAIIHHYVDAPDQKWRVKPVGDGFVAIINNYNHKALSTLQGGSAEGTPVHLWDYLGFAKDQHWAIRDPGTGTFQLMNRSSRRVASCLLGDTRDNTRLELADKTFDMSQKHQNWRLEPITPVTRPEVSGMWSAFTHGGASGQFSLVTHAPFRGTQSQRVTFVAGTGEVGIENQGLNRSGMNIQAGVVYDGYVHVRAEPGTVVHVGFESATGDATLASKELTTTGADWARYDFALAPVTGDTHGRFVIKLLAPGTIDVGYAFVHPEGGARYKSLPVRRDLAEGLVAQGNTFLRFGGSMVNTGAYRWKNMQAARDARPYTGGLFYRYGSNGWGIIEFLNLAEAKGVIGIPAVDIDETADDLVHFLQYVNGPTNTPGGELRARHGHPQPYNLRYLELGNELSNRPKADAPLFFEKFAALAPRLWAADSNIILVLGDWEYPERIDNPDNLVDNPRIANLSGHKKVLDLAAHYGREVWIDCHVWTDDVDLGKPTEKRFDAFVLKQVEALKDLCRWLAERSPGASFKLVVFELNASTHDAHRALANAIAIGAMQRFSNMIRMVASANSLQPYEQNDNVWDQGLLFFDSRRTWAQPAWYVTQMKAKNYLPEVVEARIHGRESATFDVTATLSSDERTMILHVVNTLDVPRRYRFELAGFNPRSSHAHFTTLAGGRPAINTAENPYTVVPHERAVDYSRSGNTITLEFAANSFSIVRLE